LYSNAIFFVKIEVGLRTNLREVPTTAPLREIISQSIANVRSMERVFFSSDRNCIETKKKRKIEKQLIPKQKKKNKKKNKTFGPIKGRIVQINEHCPHPSH
jgi:hypothetical protein